MAGKKMRFNIGMQLITSVSAIVLVTLTVFTTITGVNVMNVATMDGQRIAQQTAGMHANEVKASIEGPLNEARALALSLEAAAASGQGAVLNREGVNAILKHVIEKNEQYLGIGVVFEPDAFDGRDGDHRGVSAHDASGRFYPYWTRDASGKGSLTLLSDCEKSDYYRIPKRMNREAIIDPYEYEINGKDILITSLAAPVRDRSGAFIGAVIIDLEIDFIQASFSQIQIEGFPGAYVNLYSAGGISVANKNSSFLGEHIQDTANDAELVEAVVSNKPYQLERKSTVTGKIVSSTGYPVLIGNTETKWIVEVNLDHDQLLANGYSLVRMLVLVGIAFLALAIVVVILFSRSISVPLGVAVLVTEQIASGELRNDVPPNFLERGDEIGDLARSVQDMQVKLRQIMGEVNSASMQVSSGSQQLSSTSQPLSQGATEQASSVEEISSSMEEMTSNIKQNADNALQTEKLARKAAASAEQGGQAVSATVEAMKQIASKIGIIEEIARSTNMLSLNASIEAARAGEYGKGFAVVASEVGKLAERSQKESAEISKLSKESVSIAENAGATIASLIPDIKHTAELVQEISAASNEQNSGAEQINAAIIQLDQVVQQNASASEESASMSEELASQAEQMAASIAYFKVESDHEHAASRAASAAPSARASAAARGSSGVKNASRPKAAPAANSDRKGPPAGSRLPLGGGVHLVLDDGKKGSGPDSLDSDFQEF